MAIAAANVFHREADGYGLLSTLLAVGSFSGALLAVRRSTRRKPGLALLVVATFWFKWTFLSRTFVFVLGAVQLGALVLGRLGVSCRCCRAVPGARRGWCGWG